MADGDFLGGLFGGVKDAGSALYGLLGGPSGTPSAGNTPTDILQQLSPEEQRRLTASTLGQLGATLLAAGQKQMPAQRAQALAQLGNIGPNIDMQLQRAVAVRNQQEALRRQNELFPLQRQQLQGQLTQQELQQQMLRRQLEQAQQQSEYRRQLMEQMGGAGPAPAAPVAGAPTAVGPSSAPADQNIPAQPMPSAAPGAPAAAAPSQPAMASVLSALPAEYLRNRLSDPNVTISDIYKEALAAQQGQEKTTFERADKLRDEFSKVAVPFNDRQTAFMTMRDLSRNATGASDMALVLSIMKVYDPTSTVTGGEAATAQNAAGVPAAIAGYYNKLIGGGTLSDKARTDLVRAAETRFEQEMDKFEKDLGRYSTLAERSKVNPMDVVEDFRNPELAAERTRKKDIDRASKIVTANEILGAGMGDLQMLKPELMSKAARDAYTARIQQLQREAEPRPPEAPAAGAPAGYGLGQNPLGAAMRQYPRGLMRDEFFNQAPY